MASGVRLAHASWDTAEDLALISCWTSGGSFEDRELSLFVCSRHGVRWFIGSPTALGVGGVLAFSMVLSVIYACCCLGRCSQLLCTNWPVITIWGRHVSIAPARRSSARQTRMRRLREVREQLAQLPGASEAVREQLASGSDEGEGNGDVCSARQACASGTEENEAEESDLEELAGASRGRQRDMCSICQERVSIWVALRPCGHTACRDCTLRLAETSQKCHMCRGAIRGVQPVYI